MKKNRCCIFGDCLYVFKPNAIKLQIQNSIETHSNSETTIVIMLRLDHQKYSTENHIRNVIGILRNSTVALIRSSMRFDCILKGVFLLIFSAHIYTFHCIIVQIKHTRASI